MAPVHNGLGGPSNDLDTIDLTFSSPEPEEHPHVPLRQQQVPPHLKREFKREPRFDSPRAKAVVPQRHMPERVQSHVQPKQRCINPHHMAQIINTSDPFVLRAVVTDLCKMSPALSGAVARGLVRHSTFAQGLMRQHRPTAQASSSMSVKHEKPSDQMAYERMKQRLNTTNRAGPSWGRSSYSGNFLPSASMSDLRVKREPPLRDDSSPEPDPELKIPSSVPSSIRKSKSFNSPQPNAFGSTATSSTPKLPSSTERFASTRNPPTTKSEERLCIQCQETYTDESETCFYHPGPNGVAKGVTYCSKCMAPISTLGCAIGTHLSESDAKKGSDILE